MTGGSRLHLACLSRLPPGFYGHQRKMQFSYLNTYLCCLSSEWWRRQQLSEAHVHVRWNLHKTNSHPDSVLAVVMWPSSFRQACHCLFWLFEYANARNLIIYIAALTDPGNLLLVNLAGWTWSWSILVTNPLFNQFLSSFLTLQLQQPVRICDSLTFMQSWRWSNLPPGQNEPINNIHQGSTHTRAGHFTLKWISAWATFAVDCDCWQRPCNPRGWAFAMIKGQP